MARLFLIALFFLPFMSQAAFWDDAGQSEFFKRVNERYIPNIPTGFFEGEKAKSSSTSALLSASTSAFTSQWEAAKRDAKEKAGIDLSIKQCLDLIDHGVKKIHFFTLNKLDAVQKILEAIRPALEAGKPA